MGRAPCCEKTGLKKGPWSPEEGQILVNYIRKNGHGSWRALPQLAGLSRCGNGCRLRWANYLKPDIKRASFTQEEERTIFRLHAILGNRWSAIASQLPGRTDNDIKNFWNTHMKKRLLKLGLDPSTNEPGVVKANPTAIWMFKALTLTRHKAEWENARLEAEARLSQESLLVSSNSAGGYHTNDKDQELLTKPYDNAPTDFFLKIWNSQVGKTFMKKSSGRIINRCYNQSCHLSEENQPNGGEDCPPSSSEIPKTPRSSRSVSSFSCASPQHSCGQPFNPNDKDNDNSCQMQCKSASAWNWDCNVKTPEELSCFAGIRMGQTEQKAPQKSSSSQELDPAHVHYTDFSEHLLDFPANNKNGIDGMITELSTNFQQQSAWPWPELHLENDKDYWNNLLIIAHS